MQRRQSRRCINLSFFLRSRAWTELRKIRVCVRSARHVEELPPMGLKERVKSPDPSGTGRGQEENAACFHGTMEAVHRRSSTMPVREPTRDRLPQPTVRPQRRPPWLRVRAPSGETVAWLRGLMRSKTLHTICEEAHCPNIGECWGHGTATFLLLGDVCTRTCGFCDVKHGRPGPVRQSHGPAPRGHHQREPGRTGRRRRAHLRHGHSPDSGTGARLLRRSPHPRLQRPH